MSEKTIPDAEITSERPKRKRRSRATRPTDASADPVASAHPRALALFLQGASIRKVALSEGVNRYQVERWCAREGWVKIRNQARAKATKQVIDRAARKLATLESLGVDARLSIARRVVRAARRKNIGSGEARGLADLSQATKNVDLIAEKARAAGPPVQVGLQVNLVDALRESRRYELCPDA